MSTIEKDDLLRIGLEHGRSLFNYHAGQRIQSLSIYMAALAFLMAAVVSVLTADPFDDSLRELGFGLCVIAFIITGCLWAIDRRNARLVELDECLLKSVEGEVKKRSQGFYMTYTKDESEPESTTDLSETNPFEVKIRSVPQETENETDIINTFEIMKNSERRYSFLSSSCGEPLQYKHITRIVFFTFLVAWLVIIFELYNKPTTPAASNGTVPCKAVASTNEKSITITSQGF